LGSNEVDWVENKACNSVGGVLTMWCSKFFQKSRVVNGRNYSVIEGCWKRGNGVSVIVSEHLLLWLPTRKEGTVE